MNNYLKLALVISSAALIRFELFPLFMDTNPVSTKILLGLVILGIGAFFVLTKSAEIIEETTGILSERTHLAGGLLQSIGTAFPDMVLGIIAAILSVSYRATDFAQAINYAVIASATTFGSNIYNVGYATWCVFRQNLADSQKKALLMFPKIPTAGKLMPLEKHPNLPTVAEIDTASTLLTILTLLTTIIAIFMVLAGKVPDVQNPTEGDLYQLIMPLGWVIFVIAVACLYFFRKSMRDPKRHAEGVVIEEKFFTKKSTLFILCFLLLAGVAILLAAESMVRIIEELCVVTGVPFVIAGVLAGIIGCLGEMLVVHDFSVNPNGRIGDAIVGVAMDNIVTIIGASIVAILGGVFLGGNALILIFVIILCFNTLLLWQIGRFQRTLCEVRNARAS